MTPRALQILQQILITAVTVVLALVIFAAFLRVLRPPDPEAIALAAQARTTSTSIAPFPGAPAPTVAGGQPAAAQENPAGSASGPICREEAPEAGAGTVLRVFYTCGTSTVPTASAFVYRVVPATDLVLTSTLQELVKGPGDDEQALGFVSFFSEATSDTLGALNLAGGQATIDFSGLESINNISTSTGSQFFVANLNANVFQFDTINAVEYRLDGSCDAFWGLMQGECHAVTRTDWERQLAEWRTQG